MQTVLVKLSAKPNFLGIKAKGPEYAKNMKVISERLSKLTSAEIKALMGGDNLEKREQREDLSSHCRAEAVGREAQTQAVKLTWAAADGLESNDADGEAFAFTTVKA